MENLGTFGSALCLVLFQVAGSAEASLINIEQSGFSGQEKVAQFTVDDRVALPYFENGATFVSFSGFFASVFEFDQLGAGGTGTLTITFAQPVSRAGFRFFNASFISDEGISAEVFSDAAGTNSLGELSLGTFAPDIPLFAGFESNTGSFARLDLVFSAGTMDSFLIDDFRFENVPEPGMLTPMLLALVGLCVIGFARRWRHTARELH